MAKKTKDRGMLRVRLKPEFRREIDRYIDSVNKNRVTNQLDISRLVREAVGHYITHNPSAAKTA
jgi:hypothetical protein